MQLSDRNFHIIGLPHTISNYDYLSCAYTQKIIKLCKMLSSKNYKVFHYGVEGSICQAENVNLVSRNFLHQHYPLNQQEFFKFNIQDDYHKEFYLRGIAEIGSRIKKGDFILCMWGWGHEPIAKVFKDYNAVIVEAGVGFPDCFSEHRVFESYAIMHEFYGKRNITDGSWKDCVIPNYFDEEDFEYSDTKEDYFLYLGRIVGRKGIQLAVDICNKLNKKLIIAGNGSLVNKEEGLNIVPNENIEFVGYVGKEQRKKLLSKAKALFVPTHYLEPFGGVTIEAFMSGTPVISTDWGVFNETVIHGVTGYRCRTFNQFEEAINNIEKIKPENCRKWALNFNLEKTLLKYEEYFNMITTDNYKSNINWLSSNN